MQDLLKEVVRRIQIVIADDSECIRETIVSILAKSYSVLASVPDGAEAVQAVQHFQPDILLLDISMPNLNGFEAALRVRIVCPPTRIIFVSEHREQSYIQNAFSVGASGYVVKSNIAADLIPAVQEVSAGREYGHSEC